MKRFSVFFIFSSSILLLFAKPAFAAYMLPYPSYMPGNKLYAVSRFFDTVKGWWSWGSIASVKYNQNLADKYLVEAKTLFEYKQYLLAVEALKRSDRRTRELSVYLQKTKNEGKNIETLQNTVKEEMEAHIATLDDLKGRLPETFLWQPEKSAPTSLPLGELLRTSKEERISVREFHVQ